ncbi:MAG: hypothetical protein JRF33_09830 [Deltaproteobacteria bacterium]|nr:hypothetical protein [Deltaproteobacteria bacterium]
MRSLHRCASCWSLLFVWLVAFGLAGCGGDESNPDCDPSCDANHCMVCTDGSCVNSCMADQTCDNGTCVDDDPELTCDHNGFTVFSEKAFDLVGDAIIIDQYDSDQSTFGWNRIELWPGVGNNPSTSAPGTYTLGSSADELDYSTCGTCVLLSTSCNRGDLSCTKEYFAISGTLTVTDVNGPGHHVVGTVTDVVLVEVTRNQGKPWVTTEVKGGDVFCINEIAFGTEVFSYCEANDDCVGSPYGEICLADDNMCVECIANTTCDETIGEVCDDDTHTCGIPPECTENADCTTNPNGAVCDTISSLCVECLAAGDCINPNEEVCDTTNGVCVECLANGDCINPNEEVCDSTNKVCVECLVNDDCNGPDWFCNTTWNNCYEAPECANNDDCAGHTVGTCNPDTGRCSE